MPDSSSGNEAAPGIRDRLGLDCPTSFVSLQSWVTVAPLQSDVPPGPLEQFRRTGQLS